MKFYVHNQNIVLKGMQSGTIHFASKNQLSKLYASIHKGTCSLVMTGVPFLQFMEASKHETMDEFAFLELQDLLQQYSVLFEAPTGLPPRRPHDHHIPLKDENQFIKIRPYRYPTV